MLWMYYASITSIVPELITLSYLTFIRKMMELKFDTAIESLQNESCPYCHGNLQYDVQADSIYVSCSCGEFEVSTFRDKYNGSLLLYYLNNGNEGTVEKNNLFRLQNVLYRNQSIKKRLFTLRLKNRIF